MPFGKGAAANCLTEGASRWRQHAITTGRVGATAASAAGSACGNERAARAAAASERNQRIIAMQRGAAAGAATAEAGWSKPASAEGGAPMHMPNGGRAQSTEPLLQQRDARRGAATGRSTPASDRPADASGGGGGGGSSASRLLRGRAAPRAPAARTFAVPFGKPPVPVARAAAHAVAPAAVPVNLGVGGFALNGVR